MPWRLAKRNKRHWMDLAAGIVGPFGSLDLWFEFLLYNPAAGFSALNITACKSISLPYVPTILTGAISLAFSLT